VDWSSRLIRPVKLSVVSDVPDILTRLKIAPNLWAETLQKLLGPARKIGSYFGGADRLNEVAQQCGCKYVKNITGRETRANAPSAG